MEFFLILITIFSLILLQKSNIFFKTINLLDYPGNLKKHKGNIPLVGGILFSSVALISLIFEYNFQINYYLLFCITFIGILDDKNNINANLKFIFSFFCFSFFIYLDQALQIKSINFLNFGIIYFPNNFFLKIFIPVLSLMLLLNAYNMSDGINGLAIIIFISFSIYISLKTHTYQYFYVYWIVAFIFFFYNIRGKVFLGDGGNYFLSMLLGSIIIKNNNAYPYNFYAEEIFLLFLIPAIDMLRIFISRIFKGKNPFLGDKNHLHHLMIIFFGNNKTLIIYLLLINIPVYLYYFLNLNINLLIFISLIFYLFFLKKCSNKKIRTH